MTRFPTLTLLAMLLVFSLAIASGATGCGGSSAGGGNGGADGGRDAPDADPASSGFCGFGANDLLPAGVGFTWQYRVSDPATGAIKTKMQSIDSTVDYRGSTVMVQTTTKPNGRTESYLIRASGSLNRLRQQDFDGMGALQRTTEYDPAKARLDESKIADGATWDETYTDIEFDAAMVEVARTTVTERWEVLDTSAACSSPAGDFTCTHIRRTRTAGGTAAKEFWYAAGVGKIRETGAQVEQLVSCGTN